MSVITCKAILYKIGRRTVFRLPKQASEGLPSRGQVMVKGTINGFPIHTALEPDGSWSHWLDVSKGMQKSIGRAAGDTVTLSIEPTKDWPEPTIPADLKSALAGAPDVQPLWTRITPMARWEWIRWITSTKQAETRQRRIEVSFSKLRKGERRPCCFNRNMCCVPDVSKNGVLLEPTATK